MSKVSFVKMHVFLAALAFAVSLMQAEAADMKAIDYSAMGASTAGISRDERTMSLDEARNYLLSLINRDRASLKLAPVALDTVASAAAQFHSDDMAARGYMDHYDLEGRSPDWRYSLFGGTNMIMENLGGPYANAEQKYDLCKSAKFCKRELEEMESGFFDELPPQDGHRKNILFPEHNLVGLGLSLFSVDGHADANSLGLTCCQEFVDEYGKFSSLPLSASNGDILNLEGRLKNGLKLYCVDVRREDMPKPIALPDLRKNYYHSYSAPNETFIGFSPEQASALDSGGFAMRMPIANNWKSGLYHFLVWVESGNGKPFIASQQLVAIGLNKPVKPLRANE